MDRIRVLHIYQNSKVGGIQQQILNVIRAYDRSKVEPLFCCLGHKGEIGREIESTGIEVIALGRKRYSHFTPGIIRDIYRIIKGRRIEILRTHKYRSNLYGRLAGILARVPVMVASEHNIYRDKERRLYRRLLNNLLARFTDRMVAVSEAIREDMVRYDGIPRERVICIHNGVDTERLDPALKRPDVRAEFGIGPGDPVLGFVGRFVESKGLPYLIDAMPRVLAAHPGAKLMLVGDGSARDGVLDRAGKLGVSHAVIMTGIRRDVPDLLAAMDIFVLPSIKEGLPNVLLEAMAMARPIVATSAGGTGEIIEDGRSGIIVPPANPEALAEAVVKLLQSGEARAAMGRSGRERVVERFGAEAVARRWEELYGSLLFGKNLTVPGTRS